MTRRLFRIAQVVFNRFQTSRARTLAKGLKYDVLWNSLSGREHQIIGKLIARYHNYFAANCPIAIRLNYSYTDDYGNGIYK
ncbi:MAG: hypothetical protein J6A75_12010 [Lachnospiraceae bacterium]|nr:hypothetical protein [Lachnospiraceae bacterium]